MRHIFAVDEEHEDTLGEGGIQGLIGDLQGFCGEHFCKLE